MRVHRSFRIFVNCYLNEYKGVHITKWILKCVYYQDLSSTVNTGNSFFHRTDHIFLQSSDFEENILSTILLKVAIGTKRSLVTIA